MKLVALFKIAMLISCLMLFTAGAIADPVADAGLIRYAANESVVLDGTGSLGATAYTWKQLAGPSLTIEDADSLNPTISGFIQIGKQQECILELTVIDAEEKSSKDTVDIVIVPSFNNNKMRFESGEFDPSKPTVFYFGGGNCVKSHDGTESWNGGDAWHERANVISFHYYEPDSTNRDREELSLDEDYDKILTDKRTYNKCGDMIITYLSKVAPDYDQRIQTAGFSTGGQPAIDVANHLNTHYGDERYLISHVTFLDVYCRDYEENISDFLKSGSKGEQRLVDNYSSTSKKFHPDVLNVLVEGDHDTPPAWYVNSLTNSDMNNFNNGIVAGAFWSVAGPGRNLQLATNTEKIVYFFEWKEQQKSGKIFHRNRSKFPAKMPEPVILRQPIHGRTKEEGILLTCDESMNAVKYQLLAGPDPDKMSHVISETSRPPYMAVKNLSDDAKFWTIKVSDEFGSTIYADPMPLS